MPVMSNHEAKKRPSSVNQKFSVTFEVNLHESTMLASLLELMRSMHPISELALDIEDSPSVECIPMIIDVVAEALAEHADYIIDEYGPITSGATLALLKFRRPDVNRA